MDASRHVIRTVEGVAHSRHGRRAAPERGQEAESLESALPGPSNLADLIPKNPPHLLGEYRGRRVDEARDELIEGKEAGKRDQKEQRGEQREQSVVRELNR